ncbi:MAG: (2Fe-2S)-binding protein [Acidobacteria bacterium]|nr:(2Fe-2S)-binding protein [Acidobacteriota bacterium]
MSIKKDPELVSTLPKKGYSRRGFVQGVGLGGAVGAGLLESEAAAQPGGAKPAGPGEVPIALQVNGKPVKLAVEPRVTLLDALRDKLNMTGSKRACDRGVCGSCTVIMDGKAVYACSVLAIDAQGKDIQTIESLSAGPRLDPVVAAFHNNDAQQCGFCTPGMVLATKAMLAKNPSPTYNDVIQGLNGNLCRCGTYVGLRKAALDAARTMRGAKNA